ncbi:MAG: hypothetical protein KKE11_02650 [Gammaproteobacteria bacterium]|nr:hypothetical protein [Gammaproteobacteria bacterium]
MPKIYATVSEEVLVKLKNIAEQNNKSFSKVVHEIIDLGLISFINNKDIKSQKFQEKGQEFDLKNREYLLRILNISSEVLRNINHEPSKLPGKTVDIMLSEIKNYAKDIVENKLKLSE